MTRAFRIAAIGGQADTENVGRAIAEPVMADDVAAEPKKEI
jgi:hypothetical protein